MIGIMNYQALCRSYLSSSMRPGRQVKLLLFRLFSIWNKKLVNSR